jgi:4-hydroxybenzoate polyprenyltransferase
MDNLISGFIAAAIFIPFVGGLAVSIGAVPFIIIVVLVVAMMLIDYYESSRDGLRAEGRISTPKGKDNG